MFDAYDMPPRPGPAGHESEWRPDLELVTPAGCRNIYEIPRSELLAVEAGTVIYRFGHTFLATPDKFYIHVHSSENTRVHVFEQVTVPHGNDLADRGQGLICFRSDRQWQP
jgi:hypothetical protein